jgi:hypothetical protein
MLNNSITSFASKVKLVINISKNNNIEKIDREKPHRILSLRNAIAHNDVIEKFKTHIPEDLEEDIYHYFVVDRIKGDGSLETVNKEQFYGEFLSLYADIEKQLNAIYENV